MSVINQMLKDLEQRSPEQGQPTAPVIINHKQSTVKIVLISVVILVSLNLLGFYIWDLQAKVTAGNATNATTVNKVSVKDMNTDSLVQTTVANVESALAQQSTNVLNLERQKHEQQRLEQQALEQNKQQNHENQAVISTKNKLPVQRSQPEETTNLATELVQQSIDNAVINSQVQLNSNNIERTVSKVDTSSINKVSDRLPNKSKMSVSRRHLTPKELVTQKLVRAEKAINVNDIIKAEKLFEEVLIIEPSHKEARKKLAALWFGRKSYQQATNLLSQGISLDRTDAELRQLKARIHVQQGQYKSAYNTLKPLSMVRQQEYQLMLANVSQKIEQYESTIQAYKILIDMQAYSGRWHLGLAIVYDKTSQFSLAAAEYALALTKSDLSLASAEFASKRMQALGE